MKHKMHRFFARLMSLALLAAAAVGTLPSAGAAGIPYAGSASYEAGPYADALDGVRLTGDGAADLVRVALSQVGYHESDSASDLSGTASGKGNYTEYGRWYGLQDLWCAMFVSWCAAQAGIGTDVIPKTSSTVVGLNRFLAAGQAHARLEIVSGKFIPEAGDLIYFKNSRNDAVTNHVGIVTGYADGIVSTVEGNTSSGCVRCLRYTVMDTYIVYVCRPAYRTSAAQPPENDPPLPVLSRGTSGESVRALQLLLSGCGYGLEADGIFGPLTEQAVRDYQRARGLAVDGIVGRMTWESLCAGTQSRSSSDRAAVRAIQTLLNEKCGAGLAVDGIFGPATRAAVTDFQRRTGIAADGIVGPVTWRALLQ